MWKIKKSGDTNTKDEYYIVNEHGCREYGPFHEGEIQKAYIDYPRIAEYPDYEYVLIFDGKESWRVLDLVNEILFDAKLKKDNFNRFGEHKDFPILLPWCSIFKACPDDFKSLPTNYFEDDEYKDYVRLIKSALNERVAKFQNIPKEEFEYAKRILKIVKEKTAAEKQKIALSKNTQSQLEYKQITDEFEDL